MEPAVHITVKQAAELAGVNPRTIRRWIERGRLPAEETPQGYRINAEDVTWAMEHVTPKTPVSVDPGKPQPHPEYDLSPLITRLEELTRENESLRAENRTLTDQLAALPAGDEPPADSWFRRLWQRITHTRESAHDQSTPAAAGDDPQPDLPELPLPLAATVTQQEQPPNLAGPAPHLAHGAPAGDPDDQERVPGPL